jgi:hypothetical protein
MRKNTNSVKGGAMPNIDRTPKITSDRRHFIGGSDARIIMGKDEEAFAALAGKARRGGSGRLAESSGRLAQLGHRRPQPPLV